MVMMAHTIPAGSIVQGHPKGSVRLAWALELTSYGAGEWCNGKVHA